MTLGEKKNTKKDENFIFGSVEINRGRKIWEKKRMRLWIVMEVDGVGL